ncbi:MAG: proton-conducting transporter membrane subunit [Candidatus Omnitrophica bacterium]|nr:proton-conducting transporter membrane subunit [Candidatus Omnitrophota bacterium]
MLIALIIIIPVFLITLSVFIRKVRVLCLINALGYLILLAACVLLLKDFLAKGSPSINLWGWIYIDALSIFFLLTTAVVSFAASVYSIGYIRHEVAEQKISVRKTGAYIQLFNLFCFTMLIVPLLNNLALVWIAIEMTTLISAFLVGFYNVKESIEAAWKYIIICSVGITFALLGIIFFYYTSSKDAGIKSLEWASMLSGSGMFNPKIVKLALIFILVGYGTKAGLAPMHNWLPDAHSQALSPISALLSGVLLKISLYAILRFVMLANLSVGYAYSAKFFVLFGLFSILIAGAFILVQKDLKRLLAYSSVENIGLISLGLGFGAFGGIFAGLFHAFNHAVTKALMFFCAGNAVSAYRSNNMNKMQGMIKLMPFTGIAMFLGFFALIGMPPFSIFVSKLLILIAAFGSKHYFLAAFMLIFIAFAFAGLLYHISRVVLGKAPQGVPAWKEPLSSKIALLFLGIFILGLGLRIPQEFLSLLSSCEQLILGK